MPFSTNDVVVQPITFQKDLVSDQTWSNLTVKLNTSGTQFTAAGLGPDADDSSVVLVHVGGFDDQRVKATAAFKAPTASGAEELGVIARVQTFEGTADEDYYYARIYQGEARLSKVVGGSTTTMSNAVFAVPQGEDVEIELICVGSAITANFTSATAGTLQLQAVDTDIPSGGLVGFRTRNSTGDFSAIEAEQI